MYRKSQGTHREPDLRQLAALANLLSIRSGGQLDPRATCDIEDIDDLIDDSSLNTTRTDALLQKHNNGLRKRFLDRLSELFANDAGGKHVSCAIMRECEKEESADIWIARNSGLMKADGTISKVDHDLIGKIEGVLMSAAQGGSNLRRLNDELWQAMLEYYSPRLQLYRKDLHRVFKSSKEPLKNSFKKSARNLSEELTELQCIINELRRQCDRFNQEEPVIPQLESLVYKSFEIRKLHNARKHLQELLEDEAAANDLHTCICFMGRLLAAHNTFIEIGSTSGTFSNLKIHPVPVLKPFTTKPNPLKFPEALKLLGLEVSDSAVKKHISKNPKVAEIFTRLSRYNTFVHAEVQLIFYMAVNNLKEVFPYLGGSKKNCFLCAAFVKSYNDFETRGGHGHLHTKWTVPRVDHLPDDEPAKMSVALRKVYEVLQRQLLSPLKRMKGIAESSIGLSVLSNAGSGPVTKKSPVVQRFLQEEIARRRQDEFFGFLENSPMEFSTESSAAQDFSFSEYSADHCGSSEVIEAEHSSEKPNEGECNHCEQMTTRNCSKCGRDWYCSPRCESKRTTRHAFNCCIGRPLNSADLLKQDCLEDRMPDDPEVEEHFGFHRLSSTVDRSKLLGLYQGLFNYLEVSADEVNDWRERGTLVENIIKAFSTQQKYSIGAYFPWFLENKHILDGSKTRDETTKEAADTYFNEARLYLDLVDQQKKIEELKPEAKRKAFIFLAMVLHAQHPGPGTIPYDDFGFCVCPNEHIENQLGGLYERLLLGNKLRTFWLKYYKKCNNLNICNSTCTFEEFWRAYESGGLIQLMNANGLRSERERFPHLDTFLSYLPNEPRPSVWRLMAFLNEESASVAINSVSVDYGFLNCKNFFEVMELKKVYKEVLGYEDPLAFAYPLAHADPLALHAACVKGELFEFASSYADVEPKFRWVMKNPYPLLDIPSTDESLSLPFTTTAPESNNSLATESDAPPTITGNETLDDESGSSSLNATIQNRPSSVFDSLKSAGNLATAAWKLAIDTLKGLERSLIESGAINPPSVSSM